MDWKIELIPLDVEDVDRSVEFYGTQVGWNVDFDQTVQEGLRFVQVTPPGSACSICFGIGLGMLPEGQKQMIQVVVESAEEARDHLRGRGVECSDVDEQPWGRFIYFQDPDANQWALQQVPCGPEAPDDRSARQLVHEAPAPVLPRLGGAHHGVATRLVVDAGVPLR
jgi:predicted enzyme related to lactoylglutathione lyase